DRDDVSVVSRDPLYAEKLAWMTAHNIVIFRMHDSMHAQRPDFTYVGLARDLGLDPETETAPNSPRFTLPETTLGALAARLQKATGGRARGVVGHANARVGRLQSGLG